MIRTAKQTGYILLPVIVAITLVAAIALMMNTESAIESNIAGSELDAQQARYVAEAGLNHALWLTQQQGCGPYGNLTDEPLGNDKYTSSLTTDLGSTNAVTINVDQDSWIRSDQPTINKGTDLKLHTRNEILGTERPLLRYDLSPIAANASILSATAWFYVTNAHAAGPIDIHLTSTDWTETDATWDSMNANMDSAVLATIPSQPVIGLWLPVNLTAQVQAWVNGQPNFGITLNSTVDGVHGQYNSRESANPPYLEVIVGTPPTSPAVLKAVGTLANGVTRDITRTDVTLQQHPAGFSLSQMTAGSGKDVMIDAFYSNRNHGNYELKVSSDPSWLINTLLQFDLPGIPAGARILSAQLELYHKQTIGGSVNPSASLHRVTRDWVEGTKSGGGTADGATWGTWDGSSNWTSGGGDYDAAPVTQSEITSVTADWESWNATALVQGWIDGTFPNYGMLLKGGGDFTVAFASREDADPAMHPKLSVTYTCACGEVCVTPQGSGNLLMVVVDPTTLVAEDQKARDLFESWGYTVSAISASANQSSFDSAFLDNDVVFISETVTSGTLGGKLDSAPIGVVSQDGAYNPDLGLAPGASLKVGGDIDIVDTDHYITRVFATGPLPVYAAGMEQLVTSGALTAAQQNLADIGGDASLVVLDKGAAMEGGGNAAGRRVVLPLGTRYRFNWDHLNANGRLIVQRALEWGGAATKSNGALLLVVANSASLNSKEIAGKALIESWGYTVTTINANALPADYDTALAGVDVVYISGSISSTDLGTKLTAATVGVLNEDAGLVDELGMAEPLFIKRNTQTIEIIDNTHYVTSGLSIGDLQILSSSQDVWTVTGALASGLQILGETKVAGTGYPPGVAILETGAALYGGGSAAGRRVQVPWSIGSAFDYSALTADGLNIMQRAIEWGAGASLSLTPIAHWKLDETTGTTAVDSVGGNDGTLTSGPTWTPGLFQGGLDFDGSSDYVDAGTFDVSGSGITMMGWFNAEAISTDDGRIVSKADGPNDFNAWWQLSTTDSGSNRYLRMRVKAGGTTTTFADSSVNLVPGQWYFAVGTYDNASGDMKLYLDGAEIASGTHAVGGALDTGPTVPVAIGANGTAERFFDGILDDVRIYNRALSAAEIAELAGQTGPIAHWKLDETSGFIAEDSSSDNDGTLPNGNDWIPALIDGGLDFDGSNDYVDAGTFDVSGSGITMMGWFNAEAITTDDGRIVSKANGPNDFNAWWQLSTTDVGADRFLRMRIKAGGTTTTMADSTVNLSTSQWYFAVATYSNASGEMKLYLNGSEIRSGSHTVGGPVDTDAAVPVAIGANGTAERFFDGILDDVRVYDYALSASEISDFYTANAPIGPSSYTEMHQEWTASSADIWETVNLGAYGVPANAVVEVAVANNRTNVQRWGGVRAVGSSLDRRFQLHEAEGGGVDAVTLHVQTDASSQIQHYSDVTAQVTFFLLGYWTGASYVELFEPFTADNSNTWVEEDLGDDGLGPNQIAEIVMLNTNGSNPRLAGVRSSGAIYQRRFNLHRAEAGGVDAITMMVSTDASSIAEVFATNAADVDFYVVGFWSAPPGTYTETGGVHGQASAASTWEEADLSGFGVPADSVAQFVISNEVPNFSRELGVRGLGSGKLRVIDLHKAEGGGSEDASLHVNVDSAAKIEWYSASGTTDLYFYPVGWWVLAP